MGFRQVLLCKGSGKLVVIWDGSPIHWGQEVKDFLNLGITRRLYLEQWS